MIIIPIVLLIIRRLFQVIFWEGHTILPNLQSSPYFWLAVQRTKVRWRFHKILWASQNIWTLWMNLKPFCSNSITWSWISYCTLYLFRIALSEKYAMHIVAEAFANSHYEFLTFKQCLTILYTIVSKNVALKLQQYLRVK